MMNVSSNLISQKLVSLNPVTPPVKDVKENANNVAVKNDSTN